MAYGRVYIGNLRKKVTALFDELRADNRLNEDDFIKAFKKKSQSKKRRYIVGGNFNYCLLQEHTNQRRKSNYENSKKYERT